MSASAADGGSDDDVFDEDMEALRRACTIAGITPGEVEGPDDGDGTSDSDDVDLLRKIRERFPLNPDSVGNVETPLVVRPLRSVPDDDVDDFETLRAIQRRFQQYQNDECESQLMPTGIESVEGLSETLSEERDGQFLNEEIDPLVDYERPSISEPRLDEGTRDFNRWNQMQDGVSKLKAIPHHFSKSCQVFVDALKKNRSYQKFIRNKMIEIEAKIEQNKDLKERTKCLMDFQSACKRRAVRLLNQTKDPRVRLISLPRMPSKGKTPTECGPAENSHVSKFRMVLAKYPISLKKQPWTKSEEEKLAKGIKQQYQEMQMLSSMELEDDPRGSMTLVSSFDDFNIASDNIRSFLPLVNWDRLASMYFTGRTGAECKTRWLNSADPSIDNSPWTLTEDKNILLIAQNRGVFNWIDMAVNLGTNRTPFQCLVRYQRSLNAYILKKDWTKEDDEQLRVAVDTYGEKWQLVASSLEGRTGPQCSNRWRKTLHPDRKRVGRWSIDEDKRLKVAVLLFGAKNWNKIAQFTPGRTQSQCRERWVNCLDPSLNLQPWTEEEDTKLKTAISVFGHCWSKVATFVPPRTDNQCRRRWKILLPHEVPLLQAAQKMKKTVLISNFVDREKERPLIGPKDFYFVGGIPNCANEGKKNTAKRKTKKSEDAPKQKRQKRQKKTPQEKDKSSKTKKKSNCKRKPLSRQKKIQTIEHSDVILELPDKPDSIDTEPDAPDDVPMLGNGHHSDPIASYSEDIVRITDSTLHNKPNELSYISSDANQTIDIIPFSSSSAQGTNNEIGISVELASQKNEEKEELHELNQSTISVMENVHPSDIIPDSTLYNIANVLSDITKDAFQAIDVPSIDQEICISAEDVTFQQNGEKEKVHGSTKEATNIADDDCLLLDWILTNVATSKEKMSKLTRKIPPNLIKGRRLTSDGK